MRHWNLKKILKNLKNKKKYQLRCLYFMFKKLIFLKIFFLILNLESTTHFNFCQVSICSLAISCCLCSAFVSCWQHRINLRKSTGLTPTQRLSQIRLSQIEFSKPQLSINTSCPETLDSAHRNTNCHRQVGPRECNPSISVPNL